jgi:uncharacterized protein (TIGR02118 family)
MTYSYFVRYESTVENPSAFIDYYRTRHALILARFPGLRKLILHTPADWHDPCQVNKGTVTLLAQMVFDSQEHLQAALHSDARKEAREDFANFPALGGVVFHQAMIDEEIYCSS